MVTRAIFPTLILFVVMFYSESHACTLRPTTLEQRFNWAPTVFSARITEVEIPKNAHSGGIRLPYIGHFEPIEVFKGSPPLSRKILDYPHSCTVPLKAGAFYIFFTYGERAASDYAEGSRKFSSPDDPEALEMLAKLRALSGY